MNPEKFIIESFEELMHEHPFEGITVNMILERADVSRSTFYRHFSSKYDLMGAFYRAEIDKLTNDRSLSWRACLRETTKFVYDNYSFFKKAVRVDAGGAFMDFLYSYSYDFYEKSYLIAHETRDIPDDIRVTLEFLCAGHIFVLRKWVERGCDMPAKDIGDCLYELIPESIRMTLL